MQIFKDIFYLFFPKVCLSCKLELKQNEISICTLCRHDLPTTCYTNIEKNLLEKKFYGRVQLEEATSLFFYHKKGKVQTLIHELKYKNQEEISTLFGGWLANEMLESNRFKTIDYVVPVPIHPNKRKKRGYNQVAKFGEMIAKNINAKFCEDKLIKVASTESQTKKNLIERWRSVDELFQLNDTTIFNNKHVLLVDDVITTGATIETCANEILKSKNVKLSVAVMAYAE